MSRAVSAGTRDVVLTPEISAAVVAPRAIADGAVSAAASATSVAVMAPAVAAVEPVYAIPKRP